MQIRYIEQQRFLNDFLPLIAELECGLHYDGSNEQHVQWLERRVGVLYASSGKAIALYTDDGQTVGFIFVVHDLGLKGVCCFGKKATIAMLGLFEQYRSKGIGETLLREAERLVISNDGECLYVDTYAANAGAIRFYTKNGFIPVAYHPGENGLDDKGQVYLYKELR